MFEWVFSGLAASRGDVSEVGHGWCWLTGSFAVLLRSLRLTEMMKKRRAASKEERKMLKMMARVS